MNRLIQPEWLDELPPADEPAIRSRHELAALWPEPSAWRLREARAGCFSHLFQARRETTNHV